jgi:hypothetical protein
MSGRDTLSLQITKIDVDQTRNHFTLVRYSGQRTVLKAIDIHQKIISSHKNPLLYETNQSKDLSDQRIGFFPSLRMAPSYRFTKALTVVAALTLPPGSETVMQPPRR